MPRSFAVPPFSPASLFANGEQGWWFDPSNFATLFQDSAGTTPVTAVEQPVGLQLDLSKGLVLGSEAVVNGNFSAGSTGYVEVLNGTVSYATGAMVAIGITGNTGVYQDVPVVSGTPYKVSWVIGTSTNWRINIYNGAGFGTSLYNNGTGLATSGVFTAIVFPTTTTIRIYAHTGTGTVATFDDISVKSLAGNHRFQTTSANRPVVSARVNLLTKTEQFDDVVWVKTPSTVDTFQGTGVQAVVTANFGVAPNGTTTADRVQLNRGAGTASGDRSGFALLSITTVATQYTAVIYAKPLDSTTDQQLIDSNIGILAAGVAATSVTISDEGNGWKKITRIYPNTVIVGSLSSFRIQIIGNVSPQTMDLLIWGADLRPTNQGVNLPAYQRVNTSTDYDSTGFPVYIKPNGSNQFMQTNSINFTATDKMTVWQGVRKLGATVGALYELSNNALGSNGTFALYTDDPISNVYEIAQRQTTQYLSRTPASFASPITNVTTHQIDFSIVAATSAATFRVNAVQQTMTFISGGNMGQGNFGNYPAYFYMRAGSSLPFNGNDYGSIARGAASTAAQITSTETYINSKTKAY
jgi:hypothetical protein